MNDDDNREKTENNDPSYCLTEYIDKQKIAEEE